MMSGYTHKRAHETVAKSLREFGYPDTTAEMIKDVHDAMLDGKSGSDLPHDIIGLFAESQLKEVWSELEKMPTGYGV